MQKLKKITKKDVKSDEKVKEVFFRYFSTLGGYCYGQNLKYQSPEWKADFHVKFGRPQYRRDAWQTVRTELKKVFPDELFNILDNHFGVGPASDFVNGFSSGERYHFCDLIIDSDRSTDEMRERAKSSLQYRCKD